LRRALELGIKVVDTSELCGYIHYRYG